VSERTRRVDHLLQEEISAIVQRELEDPRVGFVTITGVSTTPDLSHATVYASVIGNEAERKATMAALGRAMPFIRHRLGDLRLKRIPELHLREDDSVERGTRVLQLLEQVEAELAGDGPLTGPADEPAPLPSPTTRHEGGPTADGDVPLPPGYRRRVDRVSLRKARQRRGR
jgi:ribosome-binding factor A